MQDIPWQPFSPHFPLTSPGQQHWDSLEAALAESSFFLALVSFFLRCIKSIGQLTSVQRRQAGTETAFRLLNSECCQQSRRTHPRPPQLIWSLTVTVSLCKREKSPMMTAREGHSPQLWGKADVWMVTAVTAGWPPTWHGLPKQQSASFLRQTDPPHPASFRVLQRSCEEKGIAMRWPFCNVYSSSALLWMLLASAHAGHVTRGRTHGEWLTKIQHQE